MKERLNSDLKEAMRNRDTVRRDTVRLLLTSIKNAEIEAGGELAEADIQVLFQKQAKQRRDSITAFDEGGRSDLAEAEQAELEIIESYLPEQMDDEAIRAVVREEIQKQGVTGMKEMGRVMGPLMGRLRGRAEGAAVQRIVREELGS